jgi:hypothetical protein
MLSILFCGACRPSVLKRCHRCRFQRSVGRATEVDARRKMARTGLAGPTMSERALWRTMRTSDPSGTQVHCNCGRAPSLSLSLVAGVPPRPPCTCWARQARGLKDPDRGECASGCRMVPDRVLERARDATQSDTLDDLPWYFQNAVRSLARRGRLPGRPVSGNPGGVLGPSVQGALSAVGRPGVWGSPIPGITAPQRGPETRHGTGGTTCLQRQYAHLSPLVAPSSPERLTPRGGAAILRGGGI